MSERCACGKHALERWCGTYADIEARHTREACLTDEGKVLAGHPTPEQRAYTLERERDEARARAEKLDRERAELWDMAGRLQERAERAEVLLKAVHGALADAMPYEPMPGLDEDVSALVRKLGDRAAKLHAALRDNCIDNDGNGQFRVCLECGMEADEDSTMERHSPGCLAAPEVKP